MSGHDRLKLKSIGQIALTVQDLERAVRFYQQTLELPLLFRAGNMAFFRCGDVRLMLSVPERPEFDHPASILYYLVDDITAAYRQLEDRDVAFESAPHLIAKMPDHELWMAFFRDSEENMLALMCHRREESPPVAS